MHRTFTPAPTRRHQYLDGFWNVILDPDDAGLDRGWNRQPPAGRLVWMPGVWNTSAGWLHYEGAAWLQRRFTVGECRAVRLTFHAVTQQAHVWLDGEPLGEHYGGYLPFSFVAQLAPGEHELVVRVDNRHDLTSTIPSAHLDWFRYGGITRPVLVEELEAAGHVTSLRLIPDLDGNAGLLKVRAELANLSDRALADDYVLTVDGEPVKREATRLPVAGSTVVAFSVRLDDIMPWTPSDPQLHQVALQFGGDELHERVGFRHIEVQGRQLLLNGQPLFIKGVNRHEDHPEWGCALPEHLMARDLDLIQELGANAIRGAHYPNDQRFLDLCDERGLLFIEEIPLWQFSGEQMGIGLLADRARAMLWAMVERDVSHPCIIAWSVSNECATETQALRVATDELIETAHQVDDTRPVTYASHRREKDLCFDLTDFACLNDYWGWYRHDSTWAEFLDRMHETVGDRPMVISEFGAGALYGYRTAEKDVLWSEEYQRQLLTDCIRLFAQRADCSGFFIWQFCDTRTDKGLEGQRALMRPRYMNNKGLVDEFRRKKLAFEAVQALFKELDGLR